MRKSLVSLGIIMALALGSVSPANATPESDDVVTSSGSSEGEDSTLDIVIGIAAVLAVGGLIAGGINWAVQQRLIPNPLPGIIPNPPALAPAPAPVPAPAPAVAPAPAPVQAQTQTPAPARATYANCTAVWNAIGRPIRNGEPGYGRHLDRDGDGIGCERRP